ncbi:short-subunit dehydrogenase [Panacagrimonas perspica]|uniref:Short-subunit dehydrogenase n=1 Tax=Panacagrimonas perspica TaxID=381431 RepID=A0A4R7P598_9GAMM|nr:SDR family oxidoreductase [Panacagrimonas perspica]TDU28868.1 short-subunit dehydrogenase [Panacagrimonas perspica]THD02425.1 short-chain dehydrogenase [Panacagrimonas perspica]
MQVKDSVVLITGANRGIGKAYAAEAVARGAKKVYAAARDPASVDIAGVVPIRLDVTRPETIAAAAALCKDVTILVNNAGVAQLGGFMADNAAEAARQQFEINFYGPLRLAQEFAPILAANGGGAIVNVLSVVSWFTLPFLGVYGATKSAAWALTNSQRLELAAQKTRVVGVHVGFVDTDLTKGIDSEKVAPRQVAIATYDGLAAGLDEVLVDEISKNVKASMSTAKPLYLTGLQA